MRRNLLLLAATLALLVGADRALLAWLGRSYWQTDPVLGFVHRPNVRTDWGRHYAHRPLRLNAYGHHGRDFPAVKAPGEHRVLFLGDSIVMGHGVTAAQAFPGVIERRAPRLWRPGRYTMINAGVQGYSTWQHRELLRRNLRFGPEALVVGFCMNDVTEPYLVQRAYGGTGLSYQSVRERGGRVLNYVLGDTGFGRLAVFVRGFLERRYPSARAQAYRVPRLVALAPGDTLAQHAWTRAEADLAALYADAHRARLPVVLVVFPHTFQLGHPDQQRPQQRLATHARAHGVTVVDVAPLVEQSGRPVSALFLDEDHYTPEGHGLVATAVARALADVGFPRP